MPQRRNGPLAGPRLGVDWDGLLVGKPKKYNGTHTGAKTNVFRANKRYPTKKFRSYQKNGNVYVERTK